MTTWDKKQKPLLGIHWWYRLVTGTKWTFPFMEINDSRYCYWKSRKVNNERVIVECKLLNLVSKIRNRFYFIKNIYSKEVRKIFRFYFEYKKKNEWIKFVRKMKWSKGWENPIKEIKGNNITWTPRKTT